jgi:hypothetical protein
VPGRFTALLHHITPEVLKQSYFALKRKAAAGVDGVMWRQYGQDLWEQVVDLHGRVHRGTYRARPSKRAYLRKEDGKLRPLGLTALEDKIVQQAVVTVLEPIYRRGVFGFQLWVSARPQSASGVRCTVDGDRYATGTLRDDLPSVRILHPLPYMRWALAPR